MARLQVHAAGESGLLKKALILTLVATMLRPPMALGTIYVVEPPLGPRPALEGGGGAWDGVKYGTGPFSGGFRAPGEEAVIHGKPPQKPDSNGRGGGLRQMGGEFSSQGFKGDDDVGGQGHGAMGDSLGARGPAGIGPGDGTGNGNGNDEGSGGGFGGGCDPEEQQPLPQPPSPPVVIPPPPEVTRDPVFFRFGSVTESSTDIDIQTPLGPWRHSRSYNSIDGVRLAATAQGAGWLNNQEERRLISGAWTGGVLDELTLRERALIPITRRK
jgi:hypothetical protein